MPVFRPFPDDHVFSGSREDIAALIGNAVPPLLAEIIGVALLRAALRRAPSEEEWRLLQLQVRDASAV